MERFIFWAISRGFIPEVTSLRSISSSVKRPRSACWTRSGHFPSAFRVVERPNWAASGIVAVGRVHVPYLLSDRRRMAGQLANIDGLQGEFC